MPLGVEGIYKESTQDSQHPALLLDKSELAGTGGEVVLLGVQSQIRKINDEELEAIFAGIKEPQTAMDDAVLRSNHALLRFKNNTID